MSPIISSKASISAQAYGLLGVTTPPFLPTGAFDALATVVVPSGGASSITFAGIPNTYTHLQLRAIIRSTYSGGTDFMSMKFNNDSTGSNYSVHRLSGNGSAASGGASTNDFYLPMDYPAAGTASSIYSAMVIDILDYASTTKNKTSRILAGYDANGSGVMYLDSHAWYNSSNAINSITFQDYTGYAANFAQYSQFALYGVK